MLSAMIIPSSDVFFADLFSFSLCSHGDARFLIKFSVIFVKAYDVSCLILTKQFIFIFSIF